MSSLWSQESSLEWMKYPPCMESYILMPYSQDRGTGIHHPSFLLLSHSSRSIVQYLLRLGIVKFFLNFRRKEQIFVYTVHLSNACYMLFPFHPPWLVNSDTVSWFEKKKWLILLFTVWIFSFFVILYPVALQPYRALADRAAAAGQRS